MPVWLRNSKPISKALLAAGLTAFGATQAIALSCLPMGPGDVYRIVQQEEEPFVILEGNVSFDQSLLPQGGKATVEIPSHFNGLMLGQRYFDQQVEGEMLLEVHCAGGECGSLTSGGRYVVFARQIEGRGVVAVVDPCGSFFFDAIGGRPGDVVLACHNGGECATKLPDSLDEVAPTPPANN